MTSGSRMKDLGGVLLWNKNLCFGERIVAVLSSGELVCCVVKAGANFDCAHIRLRVVDHFANNLVV